MIEIEHFNWQTIQTEDLNLRVHIPTEHCRLRYGLKQAISLHRITEHSFTIDLETVIKRQWSDLENESR
jgi:hypothetical protein